mmetsp:Transcript_2286/g.8794  ORF Transcript_2286/g.8794 Transcript_2286/m.8794 type:complete len:203 (+) Transcript_2286:3253-3861(+)
MFSSRLAASRTTANASTINVSTASAPFAKRSLNSFVFSFNCSEVYSLYKASKRLHGITTFSTISSIVFDAPVGIKYVTSLTNRSGFLTTSLTLGRRVVRSRTNPGRSSFFVCFFSDDEAPFCDVTTGFAVSATSTLSSFVAACAVTNRFWDRLETHVRMGTCVPHALTDRHTTPCFFPWLRISPRRVPARDPKPAFATSSRQ